MRAKKTNLSEHPLNQQTQKQIFVRDAFSALAAELRQLLIEQDDPELAAHVRGWRFSTVATAGEDSCATIYTRPKPKGSFGQGLRNVRLSPDDSAFLVLNVVDGDIECIELLERLDMRDAWDAVLEVVQQDK